MFSHNENMCFFVMETSKNIGRS